MVLLNQRRFLGEIRVWNKTPPPLPILPFSSCHHKSVLQCYIGTALLSISGFAGKAYSFSCGDAYGFRTDAFRFWK